MKPALHVGLSALTACACALGLASTVGAQPKPVPPPTLPAPAVLGNNALRNVPSLTPAARVKLLSVVKSTIRESDLLAPIRLDLRNLYLGPRTYLELIGRVNVSPQYDPPATLLSLDSWANVVFPVEPGTMYLVDCLVSNERASGHFATSLLTTAPGTPNQLTRDDATFGPPSDGHLTVVVRPDPRPRDAKLKISSDMSNVLLGTCEITAAH